MEFIDIPTEQTTAATDALLALIALGAFFVVRRAGREKDRWKTTIWVWAWALLFVASALGAVAHGFKMSQQTNDLLWQPLNLALGLTIAMFVVGVVHDAWGETASRRVLVPMIVVGVAFFVVTRLIPGSFLVFVLYEAVAMLFALVVYTVLAAQKHLVGAWWMAAGILVTIVAAGIQASGAVQVTVVWEFDHNGIFHIVQMVGVALLVTGLRKAFQAQRAEQ